jgi:DNA invertase Pin-like site-specific DNA recombinase
MRSAIAYYRVSTQRQGKSGLGLEAQQAAVRHYCSINGYTLLQEIQEVKSTRKQRPGLQEALLLCQKIKATLIIARLDRLGRDVEEIAHNIKLPVEIIVADNPHANRLTIHILAAVAEEQRRLIAENTRVALQAAKRRGTILGKNGKILSVKNKQAADEFAMKVLPVLNKLKKQGFTTIKAITQELNRRKVPTFRIGCKWHLASVHNLIGRMKKICRVE